MTKKYYKCLNCSGHFTDECNDQCCDDQDIIEITHDEWLDGLEDYLNDALTSLTNVDGEAALEFLKAL